MQDLIKEIEQDVADIFKYDILTTKAQVVPTRNDQNLTFQMGADKKGKLLETCVLMVDIRNSTKISKDLKNNKIKLGKIYSAFIHAMTIIADEYGFVRNIVGDRVMVVFEPENCYKKAIECAILMYSAARKILLKYFQLEDFKVGIGIEHGEMLVLKTGIKKKHEEQSEYKSLVWVGDTANTASKLCDYANKSFNAPLYTLTYEDEQLQRVFKEFQPGPPKGLMGLINGTKNMIPLYEMKFVKSTQTVNLNCNEFNKEVEIRDSWFFYKGIKVNSFAKQSRTGTTSAILISGKVYKGFTAQNPTSPYLKQFESKTYPDAPSTGGYGIYGASIIANEFLNLKK